MLTDEDIAKAIENGPCRLDEQWTNEFVMNLLQSLQQTRQDLRELCEKMSSPVAWDMEKTQMADEFKKKYGWEGQDE